MRSTRSLGVYALFAFVLACNALVGNDPPTLRAAVVEGSDSGLDATFSPPGPTCSSDEKVCVGTCVPKFNSGFSCASETSCEPCPQPAHATPICNGAVCGAECKKGYDNCDTASPDCETDLASAKTCGGCNVVCAKFCSPDGAGSFKCTESCDVGLEACGQQCVDLQTTTTSCGGCDIKCPEPAHSTATCQAAHCGFVCDPGFHACGGQCVSDTDTNACGASCTPCGVAPPHMTMACNKGACESACDPGWSDCDGDRNTGCETDVRNDNAHCGKCTIQCTGGVTTQSTGVRPLGPGIPGPVPEGTCCLAGACVPCNSF